MTLIIIILCIVIFYLVYSAIRYSVRAIYYFPKLKAEIKKLYDAIKGKNGEIRDLKKTIELKDDQLKYYDILIKERNPFSVVSDLVADVYTIIYEEDKRYLRNKSRPAYTAAEIVSQLKKKTHAYIADYKSMLYKYEFLLSTFPELKRYVDDEEALLSLSKVDNYSEFKENRDCCRDYLTDEEYKSLSVIERNQLALDRYKKKPKSNWTVGMLYEMYIGHLLHDQYDVVQFGIINGVEDLGRDIIAKKKYPFGKETIYIIQCKNWSATKEIHENVVCQIFGTTMEYEIKNKKTLNQEIVPVLCVTTRLSQTAQIFAERLGVKVYVKPMGDFPMIKCNINNGQKIYHLPFDQQYWRTKIEKPGEFYAWTVEEATKKGFRRALKHLNY